MGGVPGEPPPPLQPAHKTHTGPLPRPLHIVLAIGKMADVCTDLEKEPVDYDEKWAEPSCNSKKPLLDTEETSDSSQASTNPSTLRAKLFSGLDSGQKFVQYLTLKNIAIIAVIVVLCATIFAIAILFGLRVNDKASIRQLNARIAELEKSLNTTYTGDRSNDDDMVTQLEFEKLENVTKLLNETNHSSQERISYLEEKVVQLEHAAETMDTRLEGLAEAVTDSLVNSSGKYRQLETNLNAVNLSLHQQIQLCSERLAAERHSM